MSILNTQENIIKRFKERHGDRYDYSLVEYKRLDIRIKVICKEHGILNTLPTTHLRCGCRKCMANKYTPSEEEIINRFKNKYGDTYDYSLVEYKKTVSNIKIICKIHGIFETTPKRHFLGIGCQKCAKEKRRIISFDTFVKMASKIHENQYTYLENTYTSMNKSVSFICPIHGESKVLVNSHLYYKTGCKACSNFEPWTRTAWVNRCKSKCAKLYIIRCFNEEESFYKIGITCQDIKKRFKSRLPYQYKVIKIIENTPEFIFDLERKMHRLHKEFKYKPKIFFEGNSECFYKTLE